MGVSLLVDHEQYFVAQGFGNFDLPQLQAAHPARYIVGAQGVEYFSEECFLLRGVCVGLSPFPCVEFFVVVVFDFFADSGQEAVSLANEMLPATFLWRGLRFFRGGLPDFPGKFLLFLSVKEVGDGTQKQYGDNKYNHGVVPPFGCAGSEKPALRRSSQ